MSFGDLGGVKTKNELNKSSYLPMAAQHSSLDLMSKDVSGDNCEPNLPVAKVAFLFVCVTAASEPITT